MAKNENILQRGRVVVRQLNEGIVFTLNELKSNKFRTFLSLLSVSIGIFTIVAILTAVDTLEKGVKKSFESLNTNQVQVSKWPMTPEDEDGNQTTEMGPGGEYRWWDYMRRPNISYDDYKFLKENLTTAQVVTYETSTRGSAKFGRKSISSSTVNLITEGYNQTNNLKIAYGRDFSETELNSSSAVAVVGSSVAETLFEDGNNAVGKSFSLNGFTVTVIGVLEMVGSGGLAQMGDSDDAIIYIPLFLGKQIFSLRDTDGSIIAVAKDGFSNEELTSEIKLVLKNYRRIRPGEKLNFSVNQFNILEQILDKVISSLTSIGWIIAIFSLLIGGFGIANIMFVSVKERTKIIGIQKALGAKKYFIMIQFLTEAVIMAIAGALVGLLIVWILILLAPIPDNYEVSLSIGNILMGIGVASLIGVLSGALPAYSAANLNPVDAINSK